MPFYLVSQIKTKQWSQWKNFENWSTFAEVMGKKQVSCFTLSTKLRSAVYCNRSCLWVCSCVFVGLLPQYTKLCSSILTKLGLSVKVGTISSWLNFGHPTPPREGGPLRGEIVWLLTTASAQCLHLSERFFLPNQRLGSLRQHKFLGVACCCCGIITDNLSVFTVT